jgi:hypothetical protein
MFKKRFLGALGTTNSKFLIQSLDKIAYTSFIAPTFWQPSWLMRHSKALMTGIVTLWHPLAPEQSFTKMQTHEPHWAHIASMHGFLVHPKSITNATCITYPLPTNTAYHPPQNSSPSTMRHNHTHPTPTLSSFQQSSKQTLAPLDGKSIP